ncbi:mannose-1-phosphate guanylyltransferase [Legionella beliardensis]|uniref:mannose-1-phosphate guanylyltransferase n=1 Tax=Legionella beliardensis TaxID=91822 RepID=A0A378I0R3_9GAMM|nr:mannose-1-phosphate guanylyltransferase/mannose-6-phosphate isomerase [Legionella beliardensis]STX28739.1 mannose-1-phosphate guanylyltransferase [Legionella beliardensis]
MILPIILAGGTGSRLWPLSRELYPKQFLKLFETQTMLQMTLARLQGLEHKPPVIICNEEHRFLVAEQLRQVNSEGSIILEPFGRNTAPTIAIGALLALKQDDDPVLLTLPADHMISDIDKFHQAVNEALVYANQGKLVAFGVSPDKPEIGYGYIKASKNNQAMAIEQFIEKPDLQTAQSFLQSGDYYWNSGIFMFRASVYLNELQQYRSDIYASCVEAVNHGHKNNGYIYISKEHFLECPSQSIDYAVMEKTTHGVVVPLNANWSDVGSWCSIWDISQKDLQNNVQLGGDVVHFDSSNNLVNSEDKLVVTMGLKDTIIINTKDVLLVATKDNVQKIKQVVEELNKKERKEVKIHREVHRPWGKFDSLENGKRYQVKHLTILPGQKISTQMHHHRAEHWIIVSGSALITKGEDTFLLTENESTYIPVGKVHTLENPGIIPLEVIEVQTGSYLGEDDIVRFEDRYGRDTSEDDSPELLEPQDNNIK